MTCSGWGPAHSLFTLGFDFFKKKKMRKEAGGVEGGSHSSSDLTVRAQGPRHLPHSVFGQARASLSGIWLPLPRPALVLRVCKRGECLPGSFTIANLMTDLRKTPPDALSPVSLCLLYIPGIGGRGGWLAGWLACSLGAEMTELPAQDASGSALYGSLKPEHRRWVGVPARRTRAADPQVLGDRRHFSTWSGTQTD